MKAANAAVKAAAGLAVVAISVTACGGSSSANKTSTGTTPSNSMASGSNANVSTGDPTATAAASLRAGLDQLFREHVDLTGFAVQTAVETGISSPNTTQALKALDDNTVALGDAIGSLYGAAAKTAFVKMWRAHIGFFVEYTKGLATHDSSMVSAAQAKLANYKRDFSAFLGGATKIPPAAIATELQGHIETLEEAIQAIVTKNSTAAAKLQMAAAHMDGTADALAGGIAKEKSLAGNADGTASALRAALTGLLIQHVAQTGAVVQTAVETSLSSPQTAAAIRALDQNTVALGDAIGSVYGAAAKTAFIKMWRAHIGFFVDYTKGLATNNKQMVTQAQAKLANYKADFSHFLGSATGLPAGAVAADLQGHINTLESAIQAIVSKSPAAADKLSMAETHMSGTAAVLAKAIADQKNLS
jgi:hypothetical protein